MEPKLRRLADMRVMDSWGEELASGQELAAGEEVGKTHEEEYFEGREGYRPGFLEDFEVKLPKLSPQLKQDAAPLRSDPARFVIDYVNFSVVMSKSRRLALFTACNIDGELSTRDKIRRSGKDAWYYDSRIEERYQVGEELYRENELDRGHLVRREDPVWGDDAELANEDTFHFTNCSPQHSGLNQRTWLGLENYILHNARKFKPRVSVFTGPVFTPSDPLYRGVRVPRSYWKVVAIHADGIRSATAYQIRQDNLLKDLEFLYGRYKTYQVSIRSVERMTGLDFGTLSKFDGFSNEELAVGSEVELPISNWRAIRI